LEAFGRNNYSKELYDLSTVVDWVTDPSQKFAGELDADRIFVVGHSRGGGIVLIHASEDERIKAVATWASVAACKTPWGNWSEEKMKEWRQTGVAFYRNSRTCQDMPLYYQLYEDFINNSNRLDVLKAVRNLKQPLLICHGRQDEAVPVEKAILLKEQKPEAELYLLDSDHVFGRKHPWLVEQLPDAMQQVIQRTIKFFDQL
jgi:uncharacterized protein